MPPTAAANRLLADEQSGVVPGPGSGEQLLLLFGERVGADRRDAPPAVQERLESGEVELLCGDLRGLLELGLELLALRR